MILYIMKESDTKEYGECDFIQMMLKTEKNESIGIDTRSVVAWVEDMDWLKRDLRGFYGFIGMFYISSAVGKKLIKMYS